MLCVELPSPAEIGHFDLHRSDGFVSVYLPTTPLTEDIRQRPTRLKQLQDEAVSRQEESGLDKHRIWPLEEHFETVLEDDDFWAHQAHSLVIFAMPQHLRTYRLPSDLAVTEPVAALVQLLGTFAVLHRGIETSPDRMSDADLVRAASFGGAHTLMVDIDSLVASTVDETTGLPARGHGGRLRRAVRDCRPCLADRRAGSCGARKGDS
ncbi:hypothetical protein PVW48_11595 [Dinoroseobacter sp. PD6]|uniref:hypothetical protein n=1 Tax=Dinoroseobacter sp. PD6 TaxID=3028384 RepID=UPI00237BB78F|nr:hypothetical protein [Dinoroseobacter sp. PD6]MDD9717393.1 hypothetical protein [Dinoroseobacter sp. PD6]